MNRRAVSLALILCLAAMTLSSCALRTGAEWEEEGPAEPLPRASVAWQAPDGDFISGDAGLWTLYLPGRNGLSLVAQHVQNIPGTLRSEEAEAIVRELLDFPANQQVDSLGGEIQLALASENPVEYSGGVVTVNLGSSALGLGYRGFYTLSLALAATLCELENVRCVNVMVAGQSVGLDTGGILAMGSVTAHPGENLPVLWEQMEAKRTPLGEDLSRTPLNAMATLYYPLEEAQGIGCETRILNFEGQTPQQLASGLTAELEKVIQENDYGTEPLELRSLMIREPLTSELEDGRRRR